MARNVNGYVLVTVIWVLAILSVIVIGFGHRALLNDRAAAYALDRTQAMMMARGAIQRGMVLLRNKSWHDWAMEGEHVLCTHMGQSWARPGDLFGDVYTRSTGSGRSETQDTAQYVIEDLEGLWNVNDVEEEILRELVNQATARKILARRTSVSRESQPVRFQTLEELRYLDSVRDKDWFGDDRTPGIREVFTTYGDNRVNLNTAPEAVLRSIPGVSSGVIDAIIRKRRGPDGKVGTSDDGGYRSLDRLLEDDNMPADDVRPLFEHCKTNSKFFKITGVATRRAGKVRARCSAVVELTGGPPRIHSWREEQIGS